MFPVPPTTALPPQIDGRSYWPAVMERYRVVPEHTHEAKVVSELYSQLPDVNFSQHVLGRRPSNLAVLAVSGLSWNDLGRPHRVLSTLAAIGNGRGTELTATAATVC